MTPDDPALHAQGGLEAYAALAAHQLGEAVALIRGAASVLEGSHERLGPGAEDALRAMSAGTERAQRFVDDLLDLARATHEPADAERGDLAAALDAARAELEPTLHRSGARVTHRDLDGVLSPLSRDEATRVFVHLLRSALASGAQRVHAAAEREGDGLLLEIADDGAAPRPGLDPFEPFGRPRGGGPLIGAGVSLPICRTLVERRGGSVTLSATDGAVVVAIRLPAVT
jgi:signal transduction histidine kinase